MLILISKVDEWVGNIWGVLELTGLLEDTGIIFVADHGDSLGESNRDTNSDAQAHIHIGTCEQDWDSLHHCNHAEHTHAHTTNFFTINGRFGVRYSHTFLLQVTITYGVKASLPRMLRRSHSTFVGRTPLK